MGGVASLSLNGNVDNSNDNIGFRSGVLLYTVRCSYHYNEYKNEEKRITGYVPIPLLERIKCVVRGTDVFEHFLSRFFIKHTLDMSMNPPFLSRDTILRAYSEAIKSRIHTSEGYFFKLNEEENLLRMLSQLQNRTYTHEGYKRIIIKDSKKRYISSPTLQDHILHHVLYQELYPVLDKRMCHNTFATRRGKGLHAGLSYFCKQLHKYRNDADLAYMKIDVSKYFYSISHDRLKQKLYKFVHNTDIQYCISLAVDSYRTSSIFDYLFAEDGEYRTTVAKGLPIGAIYSQIFANFYLYDVDWYINQHIKPFVYMRYMDDMVFVDTKDNLIKMRGKIIELIENQGLVLVPKKVGINTFSHGLTLLGWRILIKGGKVIRMVGKNNKKKLWKSIDAYNNLATNTYTSEDKAKIISSIEARKSHFHHTKNPQNYFRGYNAHISSIVSLSVGKQS